MRYTKNPNDFIEKEVVTYYKVNGKKFKTKKEAQAYVIKSKHLTPIKKHKYYSYIVLYDFTLDKEVSKPELDSTIELYDDEKIPLDIWMEMCEKYVKRLNYNEGYQQETQDGRDVRYTLMFYKMDEKGELELLWKKD